MLDFFAAPDTSVPSQGVNISVDYAWGKAGSSGLYVYIGDSF